MFREFKGVFLIILFLVLVTKATSADLFVTKTVKGNRFSATTLDFSQRDTATGNFNSILFNLSGLVASGFKIESVRVKKDGRENFNYRINTLKTAGDEVFCQALQLTVLQNWQIKYQGGLLDLNLSSMITDKNYEDWIFYLELNHNETSLTNKICDFNFIFKTEKTTGFWDEEILTNHVRSGTWTLQ